MPWNAFLVFNFKSCARVRDPQGPEHTVHKGVDAVVLDNGSEPFPLKEIFSSDKFGAFQQKQSVLNVFANV